MKLVNSSHEFDICKGTIQRRVERGAPAELECTLLVDWSTTESLCEVVPYTAPSGMDSVEDIGDLSFDSMPPAAD